MAHLASLLSAASMLPGGIQLMYNNDGENLMTVTSPYHARGAPIDASTIIGTVEDTRGNMDANMICPFHNVPWWASKLEPPEAHRDWYDETFNFSYNTSGGSQLDFVLRGGDFIGTFTKATLNASQTPLVTIRLNDGQMCAHSPTPNDDSSLVSNDHQFDRMSQYWWEHRNDSSTILGLQQTPPVTFRACCWIDDPQTKKPSCACPSTACELSWLNAEVRARIVNLLGELAATYAPAGLAGIELDFERSLDYFPASTPNEQRRTLMMGFVRDVRAAIDAAPGGEALTLGVRLSPHWEALRAQGLDDLRLLTAPSAGGGGGIGYITWGVFFWCYQPHDSQIASLAAATPAGVPTFWEAYHSIA